MNFDMTVQLLVCNDNISGGPGHVCSDINGRIYSYGAYKNDEHGYLFGVCGAKRAKYLDVLQSSHNNITSYVIPCVRTRFL